MAATSSPSGLSPSQALAQPGTFTVAVRLAPYVWEEGWSVKLQEELPKLVLFSSPHFQTFSSEHHCMDSSIGTQE